MVKWPERVNITPEGIATLEDILVTSYNQILGEINSATNFGVANRKVILAQIDAHLQTMGVNVNDFISTEIPAQYKDGANDAVNQLTDLGAEVAVKTGFNTVHTEAINALVSDTASSFADAMQGVHRSAQRLLSAAVKQQITQNIATGMAQGSTLDAVKKQIKGTLADNGLDSLVDKSGRSWTLDRYAEMLYRTKMAEARNLGMVNRMAENGYDLVQVSAHGAIDVCGPWEGQILSTTGATREYEGESISTVQQATDDGLFHPNCRHALNAIVPYLAANAYGYDKTSKTYVKGQINILAKQAAK